MVKMTVFPAPYWTYLYEVTSATMTKHSHLLKQIAKSHVIIGKLDFDQTWHDWDNRLDRNHNKFLSRPLFVTFTDQLLKLIVLR